MILLTKVIQIPSTARDADPITIIPIGDIQWNGSKTHTALSSLQSQIAEGVKTPNTFFLGMGDYIDAFSPSNRTRLQGAALYDTAQEVIDLAGEELTASIFNLALKPSKGRWLGLLEGHHFSQFRHGQTSDQYLAKLLDTTFLGTTALIRLVLQCTKTTKLSVVLWAHHGAGGGGKAGSPLMKLENLAPYWGGVDVFLIGHSTKGPVVPIDRVHPVWSGQGAPYLDHKKVLLVSTGGFSKSYNCGQERGGYAEQRLLNPAQIGVPIIRLYPYRTQRKGQDNLGVEIKVEV